MTPLIERNTTIPVKKSQVFSTADDNQTAVDIHILQGERPMAGDNMTLGHFRLEGIPPAPRGLPQVEVTFDIDANGILNVGARDKATGKEQKVTITASTNLNKGDVERMVSEAKKNEAADKRQRELVEARNNADTLAYTAEKTLQSLGERVPGNDRQNIEKKIAALREAMKSDDTARIRQLSDEVQQASYALGQMAGQQPGQQSGGTNGPASHNGSGNGRDEGEVVEGEFHEA